MEIEVVPTPDETRRRLLDICQRITMTAALNQQVLLRCYFPNPAEDVTVVAATEAAAYARAYALVIERETRREKR